MNKVVCENGHFFDGDTYKECPHCKAGIKNSYNSAVSENDLIDSAKYKPKWTFGKKKNEQRNVHSFSCREDRTELILDDSDHTMLMSEENDEMLEDGNAGKSNMLAELPKGLLICVSEKATGAIIRLHEGDNDVEINTKKDYTSNSKRIVAQQKICISYSDVDKTFAIEPSKCDGQWLVNNEVVESKKLLKMYDCISSEGEKYILITICGNEFDWTELNT